MDVAKTNHEEWYPTWEQIELLRFRMFFLLLWVLTILFFICLCYCHHLFQTWGETSEIVNSETEEIENIELQPLEDEEATEKLVSNLEDDDLTPDINDDIGNQSDSRESESISGDNGKECVIIHAYNTGDDSDGTFTIEKNSHLDCSSKDDKGNTSNISNDSDIKLQSEVIVEKCDIAIEKSDQCSSQDDFCGKLNAEDDYDKIEVASGSSVSSRDSKA